MTNSMNIPHMLFAGPAGTGKSSLALIVVKELYRENWKENYLELNASDERGIKRTLNGLVRLDLIKRVGKSSYDPSAYYELNKQYHVQESPPIGSSPKQLELF